MPITSTRAWDTRTNVGNAGTTKLNAGETRVMRVFGIGGIPSTGVSAIIADITALGGTTSTTLVAYPNGTPKPAVTTLSVNANEVASTTFLSAVSSLGEVAIHNVTSATHVIVDIQGYVTNSGNGSGFQALTSPVRIADTRPTSLVGTYSGTLAAGASLTVSTQQAGVPDGATSAFVNVTVISPSASGHLTLHGSETSRPATSSLDFLANRITGGSASVSVANDERSFTIYNGSPGTLYLTADVQGFFEPMDGQEGDLRTATSRLFDSRSTTALSPREVRTISLPVGSFDFGTARAIFVAVHAVGPTATGHLQVFADGYPDIGTSDHNFTGGRTSSSLAATDFRSDGRVSLRNVSSGTVHVIIDLQAVIVGTPLSPEGAFVATADCNLDTLESGECLAYQHSEEMGPDEAAVAQALDAGQVAAANRYFQLYGPQMPSTEANRIASALAVQPTDHEAAVVELTTPPSHTTFAPRFTAYDMREFDLAASKGTDARDTRGKGQANTSKTWSASSYMVFGYRDRTGARTVSRYDYAYGLNISFFPEVTLSGSIRQTFGMRAAIQDHSCQIKEDRRGSDFNEGYYTTACPEAYSGFTIMNIGDQTKLVSGYKDGSYFFLQVKARWNVPGTPAVGRMSFQSKRFKDMGNSGEFPSYYR